MESEVCSKVICKDIAGNTYDVPIEKLVFRPSAYAVILQNNQILLTPNWNGYDFPGGGVKLGEPIENGLQREVKEETGLEVYVGPIILCGDSFFKMPYSGKFVHALAHYYLCTSVGGTLSTDFLVEHEKEYSGMPVWVDLVKISTIKFYSALDAQDVLAKAQQY
jgi:ADP-ribose pyrophosphatase YjhB (NUDIX family)